MSRFRVGEEKLLTLDLIAGDRGLPFGRDEPVDERPAHDLIHVRVPGRVDEHDAVLVEEPRVALDEDGQRAAILERQPRAAVGKRVRVHARGRVQRRAHPRARRPVPGPLRVDAARRPQAPFGRVRTALVAARGERRSCGTDLLQRRHHILHARDAGGVQRRPDDDEVVVHDVVPVHEPALPHHPELRILVVHEDDVAVAALAHVERLAGALGDDAHADTRLRFEQRQDVPEQARVLGRGRRRHDDELLLRPQGGRHRKQSDEKNLPQAHGSSPLTKAPASAVDGTGKNSSIDARSATRPWCR